MKLTAYYRRLLEQRQDSFKGLLQSAQQTVAAGKYDLAIMQLAEAIKVVTSIRTTRNALLRLEVDDLVSDPRADSAVEHPEPPQ